MSELNSDAELEPMPSLPASLIQRFTYRGTRSQAHSSFNDAESSETPVAGSSHSPRRSPVKREQSASSIDYESSASPEPQPSPSKRGKKVFSPAKSPTKPKKLMRGYADPSVYAHLNGLTDAIEPGLRVIWCGINPGIKSASSGHAYANPTNHFWKLLYRSGFTDELMKPVEDAELPARARCGLTNLVERPTAEANELSTTECRASVPSLVRKLSLAKPRFICFVGKGIADHFVFVLKSHIGARSLKASMGLQPLKLRYGDGSFTYAFVTPSSSGLVRGEWQFDGKLKLMKTFKTMVNRVEAGETDAIEHELTDAAGAPIPWHTLDVESYLGSTPA